MQRRVLAASVATLALVGPGLLPGSSAATTSERADAQATPVARGLVSPLSLAIGPDGTRYFSENFAGKLRAQKPGGPVTTLFKTKGAEVGAVSVVGDVVTFAVSRGNNARGVIKRINTTNGNVTRLAGTTKHEKRDNPDQRYRYGFRNLSGACKQQIPDFIPVSYRGVEETHPYATTTAGGTTYVADAGANAIFAISAAGDISTVGAVPPAKVKITPKGAAANGLPKCTVGKRYFFEAVPTDVEVGPDGNLYITSLPGGPEDGSLGKQGRVLRMNPATGRAVEVADGLASPTGLAVAPSGDILVAELFRGRISRVSAATGIKSTFADAKMPGDVEIAGGATYATRKVLTGLGPEGRPRGQVVQLVPSAS